MNKQMGPVDAKDEKMHIEGEEEETTMGEGMVAVEGETTQDGQELPVVVQQPEVHATVATTMPQQPTGQTAAPHP
jgi:hypothetical protein